MFQNVLDIYFVFIKPLKIAILIAGTIIACLYQ